MGQVVRVEDPASDVDAWRVLDAFTHCLVVIDAAGLVRHTNAAMRRLDADAGRFVPGADFLAGCAAQFDEGAGELRVALSDVLSGLCQRQELELSYRAPSGRRWMTMVLTPCEVGGARGALADASDVTYRTEAEAAVRESEARYRTLVDGSPDIVFITDEASRMIYANRALEEQTGYTVADFQMPQRENRLLHPDDRERVAHVIAEFLASGSHHSERIENRFITKTGEVLWYSSVISRTDYQGRPALQFVVHNVTAEQRALDESAARRREAERALRVRDQFLSAAAHELKTPVTTLMAYAQWLGASLERGQTIAPARAQKALAAIDRQSRALDRIVSQLLDIGHLETDQLVLRRAPADVAALVRQRAERSKAPIVVQAPPRVVAYVDPLRLVQVVDNLIDNALRFAPRGSQVDVSVVELEGAVEIAVTDRGEGIAPEIRQQIFERAAPDGAGGHRRGIGVGLWTSRRLVELHGGTLRLESPVGGRRALRGADPQGGAVTPARGRVLVVDDDDDIRELLEDILTDRGYETAGAPDGKAALEAAAGFHPTLILLDMRMPVMDGWEFARRYRSKPGDHAHLVVVSAARDARERAESIHADGWLAKPFDLQDLLATVERYASDAGAR